MPTISTGYTATRLEHEDGTFRHANQGQLRRRIPKAVHPAYAQQLRRHGVEIVPVSEDDASFAAEVWPHARRCGLSLGDRLCLALGHRQGATVLTADRAWLGVDIDVDVRSIR